AGAAHRRAIQAELAQYDQGLLQGHLRVVDDQHPAPLQQLAVVAVQQLLDRRLFEHRRDIVQHLLDIEDLHDGAVDLGHPGDERTATGTGGRRPHIATGTLHDALDALHMQPLTRAAQLGDDQTAFVLVGGATLANGARQVDYRQGRTTQCGDATHVWVTVGQPGQWWAGNDLVDLEKIDAQ